MCFLCFVLIFVLCIFIFVCTSVGLLPPGESPIAVSNNNNIYVNYMCIFWNYNLSSYLRILFYSFHICALVIFIYCIQTSTLITLGVKTTYCHTVKLTKKLKSI